MEKLTRVLEQWHFLTIFGLIIITVFIFCLFFTILTVYDNSLIFTTFQYIIYHSFISYFIRLFFKLSDILLQFPFSKTISRYIPIMLLVQYTLCLLDSSLPNPQVNIREFSYIFHLTTGKLQSKEKFCRRKVFISLENVVLAMPIRVFTSSSHSHVSLMTQPTYLNVFTRSTVSWFITTCASCACILITIIFILKMLIYSP